MSRHRRPIAALGGIVLALIVSGCAGSSAPGASLGTLWPEPPSGEVVGQGTVMDVDGDVELCLGAIAESFPPQCQGIPITNWSWDGVDGSETSDSVRWGAYAVQGTYDGAECTVTQPPIMLALDDPMMTPDPTDGTPGDADEATLVAIQDTLPDRLGDDFLSAGAQDGRLWVDVVWDDGTWQQAADAEFGADVVVVRSALRTVDG